MKKILLSLLLVTSGLAYSFEPVLGRDYSLLENPLPTKQDGKVEVIEIFWYGCGHCYAMESKIKACKGWSRLPFGAGIRSMISVNISLIP